MEPELCPDFSDDATVEFNESKKLGSLVSYFRKVEERNQIDQRIGGKVIPVRNNKNYGYSFTPRQKKAIRDINSRYSECGMCFGLHLADYFETRIRRTRFLEQANAVCDLTATEQEQDILIEDKLPCRHFEDGAEALFVVLWKDKIGIFKKWCAEKGYFSISTTMCYCSNDDGKTVEIASRYLHEQCGAPLACLHHRKWPHKTLPHEVIQRLCDLHPELV